MTFIHFVTKKKLIKQFEIPAGWCYLHGIIVTENGGWIQKEEKKMNILYQNNHRIRGPNGLWRSAMVAVRTVLNELNSWYQF